MVRLFHDVFQAIASKEAKDTKNRKHREFSEESCTSWEAAMQVHTDSLWLVWLVTSLRLFISSSSLISSSCLCNTKLAGSCSPCSRDDTRIYKIHMIIYNVKFKMKMTKKKRKNTRRGCSRWHPEGVTKRSRRTPAPPEWPEAFPSVRRRRRPRPLPKKSRSEVERSLCHFFSESKFQTRSMQIRTLPRNFPSSNTFDTLLVSFLNFTGLVGLASWHLVLTFFTTDFTHRHLQDLAAPRPSLRLPFLHSCGWPFWTQKCCFCWCLISFASLLFLPSFASFAYSSICALKIVEVVLYDFLFRA